MTQSHSDEQVLETVEGPETCEPRGLAVHHDVRVPVVVALVCAVLTVVWFSRALESGAILDWLWCAVPAAVGLLMLTVLRDARAPLLVADEQGIRVRHRDTWNGVRWPDVERLEVRHGSRLRDGELVVHPDGAHESGAFSVPLGRGTRVVHDGLTGVLGDDLDSLAAAGLVPVVAAEPVAEVRPELEHTPEPEPGPDTEVVSESLEVLYSPADQLPEQREPDEPVEGVEGVEPVEAVEPVRAPRRATRAESVRDTVRQLPDPPAIPAQRGADGPLVVARVDDVSSPPVSVAEPVIGPLVAAARHRARLTIDTLSERTRIRPHVLECIEVDDFEACGGDFYARGHLRTLARVFGLDGDALVATYDERYARPEIEARQVFEAELATGIGGGVRTATTGPQWSMLAAAVLVLVAIWGSTRIFTDEPQELVSPSPAISDTVGLAGSEEGEETAPEPVSTLGAIRVVAQTSDSQVVVRDDSGRILWAGRLAEGQEQRVIGNAPFDVTASNGAAVRVVFLGRDRGTVGSDETADNRRFG